MQAKNNNYWSICKKCQGQAKILQGPSKRARRNYQKKIQEYQDSNLDIAELEEPKQHLDICPECSGTGLVQSDLVTSIDNEYPKIAIVGGGIGGTALAVACMHRGIPFTLYERDESFDARSQGYGLTLQQASKAIEGLGIESLNDGIISTRHVVHTPKAKIIGEWGLRKWLGQSEKETSKRKNIHIARQSLRSELLNQLGGHGSFKWGHKLVNFSQIDKGGYHLNFQVNGNIESATADLIVGADGIRSSVRNQLVDEDKTPLQYLGCIVMLGICPLGSLDSIESSLLDSATVFQTVNGHERIYMMPYDKDSIMWQLSFPVDESEAVELNKKGSAVMKKEALKRLQKWHSPIPEILNATDKSMITGYPVYDRALFNSSLLEKTVGNVTLIGDAAHPMSPFKGQGANQAILDALLLARKITASCGADSGWRQRGLRDTVLTEFEKEMSKRTAPKVKGSRAAVELLHSDAVLHEGDNPRGRGIV